MASWQDKKKSKATRAAASTFIGFGAFAASDTATAPAAAPTAAPLPPAVAHVGLTSPVYTGADSDLNVAFRRLGKRDWLTKTKALQDLAVAFPDRSRDVLADCLPFWTYVFPKLCLDNDRRVREATFVAFTQLVTAVRKGIAKYLPALITPWWCGMVDPVRDVATAATGAFHAAFSPAKRHQATLFVVPDLVAGLTSILAQSRDDLSDPKYVAPADAEDRLERAHVAAVVGLGKLLGVLATTPAPAGGAGADATAAPSGDLSPLDVAVPFVRQALLSKVAPVRCAAYRFVRDAIQHSQAWVTMHVSVLAPTLFGAVGDKVGANRGPLLDVILVMARGMDSIWGVVDPSKAFMPGMLASAKRAFYGAGLPAYRSMLPLVASLPADVLARRVVKGKVKPDAAPLFVVELLHAMVAGASNEAASGLEADIVNTVCECAYYLVALHSSISTPSPHGTTIVDNVVEFLLHTVLPALGAAHPALPMEAVSVAVGRGLAQLEALCVKRGAASGPEAAAPLETAAAAMWRKLMKLVQSTPLPHLHDTAEVLSVLWSTAAVPPPTALEDLTREVAAVASRHLVSSPAADRDGGAFDALDAVGGTPIGAATLMDGGVTRAPLRVVLAHGTPDGGSPWSPQEVARLARLALAVVDDDAPSGSPASAAALFDTIVAAAVGHSALATLEVMRSTMVAHVSPPPPALAKAAAAVSRPVAAALDVWSLTLDATPSTEHPCATTPALEAVAVGAMVEFAASGSKPCLTVVCHLLACTVFTDPFVPLFVAHHVAGVLEGAPPTVASLVVGTLLPTLVPVLPEDAPGVSDIVTRLLLQLWEASAVSSSTPFGAKCGRILGDQAFVGHARSLGVWAPFVEAAVGMASQEAAAVVTASEEAVGEGSARVAALCSSLVARGWVSAATLLETVGVASPKAWAGVPSPSLLLLCASLRESVADTVATPWLPVAAIAACVAATAEAVQLAASMGPDIADVMVLCHDTYAAPALPDDAEAAITSLHHACLASVADVSPDTSATLVVTALEWCQRSGLPLPLRAVALRQVLEAVCGSTCSLPAVSAPADAATIAARHAELHAASDTAPPAGAVAAGAAGVGGGGGDTPVSVAVSTLIDAAVEGDATASVLLVAALPPLLTATAAGAPPCGAHAPLWRATALSHLTRVAKSGAKASKHVCAVAAAAFPRGHVGAHDARELAALLPGLGAHAPPEAASMVARVVLNAHMDALRGAEWSPGAGVPLGAPVLAVLRDLVPPDAAAATPTVARLLPSLVPATVLSAAGAGAGGEPATTPGGLHPLLWAVTRGLAAATHACSASRPAQAAAHTVACHDLAHALVTVLEPGTASAADIRAALGGTVDHDVLWGAAPLLLSPSPVVRFRTFAVLSTVVDAFAPELSADVDIDDGEKSPVPLFYNCSDGDGLAACRRLLPAGLCEVLEAGDTADLHSLLLGALLLLQLVTNASAVNATNIAHYAVHAQGGDLETVFAASVDAAVLAEVADDASSVDSVDDGVMVDGGPFCFNDTVYDTVTATMALRAMEGAEVEGPRPPTSSLRFTRRNLARACLFKAALTVPAKLSEWGTRLHSTAAHKLESYFADHVSRVLFASQMARIREYSASGAWDPDEFTVRGRPASNEVVASYGGDEVKLQLVVRLPLSYPMRRPEVSCDHLVGITADRMRHWQLQMVTLLSQKDGSMLDVIKLFKHNLDREFEGVEPCPICFSVVSATTNSLPRFSCPTCKNKFHSSCLQRWFQSAGHTKCPLCQVPLTAFGGRYH